VQAVDVGRHQLRGRCGPFRGGRRRGALTPVVAAVITPSADDRVWHRSPVHVCAQSPLPSCGETAATRSAGSSWSRRHGCRRVPDRQDGPQPLRSAAVTLDAAFTAVEGKALVTTRTRLQLDRATPIRRLYVTTVGPSVCGMLSAV